MDISKLPKALKDLKAFCLYRLEPGKNPNKPDKVPYQPNGARASPNKPETFTDFKSVYQLQRTSDMRYIIETTKTDAGTRKLPITEDVAQMF